MIVHHPIQAIELIVQYFFHSFSTFFQKTPYLIKKQVMLPFLTGKRVKDRIK